MQTKASKVVGYLGVALRGQRCCGGLVVGTALHARSDVEGGHLTGSVGAQTAGALALVLEGTPKVPQEAATP